jgi:hypothetical protein
MNPKRTLGIFEFIFFFLAFAAFVLAIVAVSGPWMLYTAGDKWMTGGLWQLCGVNGCFPWSYQSPAYSFSSPTQPVSSYTFLYYDYTPAVIAASQAFWLIGITFHLFVSCCAIGGIDMAITSLSFPAIFYTVAYACGASFYYSVQNPQGVTSTTAYGSICGAIAMGLMWVVVFGFIGDLIYRTVAKKKTQKDENELAPTEPKAEYATPGPSSVEVSP